MDSFLINDLSVCAAKLIIITASTIITISLFISMNRHYSPNFLRISLGMAFLLMRKSIVLATMKALVMYQIPL